MASRLAVVKRGSIPESEHLGSIAVTNSSGELLYHLGDPKDLMFPRSALKPIQAVPLLESGAADFFSLEPKEIAICCGSHNGEDIHTETVSGILDKIGLDKKWLVCGAHPPVNKAAYEQLMKEDRKPSSLYNNCSGKHAGMLALASFLKADLTGYHLPGHPVQVKIREVIEALTGIPQKEIKWGIDGCGLPAYVLPLNKLAQLFSFFTPEAEQMGSPYAESIRRIRTSITAYPEMIGGKGEPDTEMIRVSGGKVLAKAGAEGVMAMAFAESGIGVAIKVKDGNKRAASPAAVEVIRQLGILAEPGLKQLETYRHPVLTNTQDIPVGDIETDFQLIPSANLSPDTAET